ncbi:MAG: hypothetical protein AB7U98_07410 [Candidatus Nitrosocosmicus sp.]
MTIIFYSFLLNMTQVYADSVNPGIYSKDSSPHGVPYGKWLANWWNWTTSIPSENHPRDSYTPEKCQINQQGPVWFLPDMLGGTEERTCIIPSGKSIFIPILVGECELSTPEIKTKEELPQCASAGNEHGVITAIVDGREVLNLGDYRTQSGFFNITIVEGNIYESNPGTFTGFADGFFVFLEPLPPGKHEVKLTASVLNPTEPNYNYDAIWTYHLVIQ